MAQLLEYIKMAIDNIKANKGRSILTMLGIIIGIASGIIGERQYKVSWFNNADKSYKGNRRLCCFLIIDR